jgi:predicted ATPase/DNA-binding SARP family transcriptional activator
VEFRILGPLEVADGGGPIPLEASKQRALLGVLLLHPNEVVSSERLIDELWGERPPATGAKVVQTYVSKLRRALGPEMIATRAPGYLLRIEEDALDAIRFRRLTAEGRRLAANAEHAHADTVYREALALWRGPPLADVIFESFARNEVERLEEERLGALMDRIDCELALGDHDQLVAELETLVKRHPLRERLHAQLMLALYRSGRQADALAAYHDARRTLVEELGLEPSRELQALEGAILNQDPALAATPRPPPRVPSNLPAPARPLIGRERELDEAGALLGSHRLLTLTGPGGSGKTRLALELAAEAAEEFAGGVYWVPLQAVRDPDLVLPTIAQTLGAKAGLAEHIGGRRILLLLDSLEQVLGAAPALAELLVRAPALKLFVTSREPLHLAAEHEYPVAPLREPDAVALFLERARAVKPDFEADEAVPEICRRLDCLPLAIELAAARTKALAPAALLQRLERRLVLLTGGARDAPERHRTLRATIAWSYDLLSEQEQTLFRRLGVFAGGWTLDAAEEVCGAELDTLASLVDKSLVRSEGERYSMLDTIREFALELREGGGTEELRRRHADYYLGLAREIDARIRGPQAFELLDQLERDHDNMREALAWLLDADPLDGLRLAVWIKPFWTIRNRAQEAAHWFAQALTRAGDSDPALRSHALRDAGEFAEMLGDDVEARRLYEEALELATRYGDKNEIAYALLDLRRFDEALVLFREVGNERAIGHALHVLAARAQQAGDLAQSRRLLEQSLAIARRLEIPWHLAGRLHSLGDFALDADDLDEAAGLYRESLEIDVKLRDDLAIAYCLAGLAAVAAKQRRREFAARLWGSVHSFEQTVGMRVMDPERSRYEPLLHELESASDTSAAFERGKVSTLDEAVQYALSPDRPAR